MRRKLPFSFLFILSVSVTSYAEVKNESTLKVVGESQLQVCQGAVPPTVDLESVGLAPLDLKDGVSCVAADFNGDGFLDFVLYGSKGKVEVTKYDHVTKSKKTKMVEVGRNLLVLFFRGKEVLRSQAILNSAEVFVFDPKSPDRKKYSEGNPLLPGLIRPGQGDRGWVYFLNEKTGLFEEVSWIAPPGYD